MNCYCDTVKLTARCPVCGRETGAIQDRVEPLPPKLNRSALKKLGAQTLTSPAFKTKSATRISRNARPRVAAPPPSARPAAAPERTANLGAGQPPFRGEASLNSVANRRVTPERLAALRSAYGMKDYNTATAILIGMAGGPDAQARLRLLAVIDAYGAKHGRLEPADVKRRNVVAKACVAELGFNPATHDAPGVPMNVASALKALEVQDTGVSVAPPTYDASRPMLKSGTSEPLRSGDWAELYRRVMRGELTESEAFAFGEVWSGKARPS